MFNLNNKKIYKEIIENLCMSSRMSTEAEYFSNISPRTIQYNLSKMMKSRDYKSDDGLYVFKDLQILRLSGKGKKKGFVFTKKAIKSGLLKYYNMQNYYDAINENIGSSSKEIVKRKSMTLSMLLYAIKSAGVTVLPTEKYLPPISNIENNNNKIYFYTSREIQYMLDHDDETIIGDNGIAYGQYFGFILAPESSIVVYEKNKSSYRFNIGSEQRTINMGTEFQNIFFKKRRKIQFDKAIYFVRTVNEFGSVLEAQNGSGYKTVELYNYHYDYVVPLKYISSVLGIICEPNYSKKILEIFFKDGIINNGRSMFYYEGITKNGEYTLTTLDCNICKIRLFKESIIGHPNEKYAVICYDWQEKILEKYFNWKVRSIPIKSQSHKIATE